MVLHEATHEPTSNASLSLTMLRLSGVKFSMSATSNQTGMFAVSRMVCCAIVENFTPLSRSMVSDKLALLVGSWVASCKTIVEENHGEIDKYLGDGFLAYWHDDEKVVENISAGLTKLKQLQKVEPRFRLVLHYGLVSSGGLRSMGEESLIGKEVIFVFRMEKLAGSLGIHLLASAAAQNKLGNAMPSQPAGSHELKGFEGTFEFFKL